MLMKKLLFALKNLKEAVFLNRPNRFVAEIEFNGINTTAHIHDPGRLKELLIPGIKLLVKESKGKHPYYVQAVRVQPEDEWILLDSALQRRISEHLLKIMEDFKEFHNIKAEVKLGDSRIDFMLDDVPLENKGVSLVKDGMALFPDAPTKRGTRHVKEIIKNSGIILFIIFRKARAFSPNFEMDPEFSRALVEAKEKKIRIICAQIEFDGENVYYTGKIPLQF